MSTAADELLARLAELGATVRPAGDHLLLQAGGKPIPGDLVKRLRESKTDLVRALLLAKQSAGINDDPAWWRRHYIVRTVDWALSGDRPGKPAQGLAWGELLNEWHNRHGTRVPQWQCAGCEQAIGGVATLTLADGSRVHLDTFDCLLSFGERWRSEAADGLRALGLDPPPGFELL
jgi:hypothetical protein